MAAAPPKKKGTIKAKIAEKEAQKAAKANDVEYDSDDVLDPKEKARRDKERELKADLHNAVDLLGAGALGGGFLAFRKLCVLMKTQQGRRHPSSIR